MNNYHKIVTFSALDTVGILDSMDNVASCWQVQERKQTIVSTFTDAFPCKISTIYNSNSDSSMQDLSKLSR